MTVEQISRVVEPAKANYDDTPHQGPQYRTTEMPCSPSPIAGEPVVEYLTRQDIVARGWPLARINEFLGEPDGVSYTDEHYEKHHFRLDRVLQAEKEERVRVVVARTRKRRGLSGATAEVDPRGLALTDWQLSRRGWSAPLTVGLRESTDPACPDRPVVLVEDRWRTEVYPATWVERMEQSPPFREWMAEVERQRQVKVEQEKEARLRVARRPAALAAAFPGFKVVINGRCWEWQLQISVAPDLMAGTLVRDGVLAGNSGFGAVVARGDETGDWAPLKDWLVAHPEVGNARFREVVGFLADGDPDGWRASRAKEKEFEAALAA